jgi:hypothetical protein
LPRRGDVRHGLYHRQWPSGWATRRVMVTRAARAITTAMRMVGDKEGNGKGGKGYGNGNKGGGNDEGDGEGSGQWQEW